MLFMLFIYILRVFSLDSLDFSSAASRGLSFLAVPCPSVGHIFPLIAQIYTDILRFCADPCHPWAVYPPRSAQGMFLSPYRSNDRFAYDLGASCRYCRYLTRSASHYLLPNLYWWSILPDNHRGLLRLHRVYTHSG